MKTFALQPKMLTLSGVFYPTGYAVIMFPDAQLAEQAARELVSGGYDSDAIMLLPPDTILREIGRVDGDSMSICLQWAPKDTPYRNTSSWPAKDNMA